ncbi:MAG: phage protease [Limnochordia bacterium]|jgi:phage I-like protein
MARTRLERPTQVLALSLGEGGELPREIQILPRGWVRSAKGDFLVDDEAIRELMAQAAQRKNDVVVDYEHQTLLDVEAPAAAWIKGLIDRGDAGLWAEVEWTPRAAEYVRNREYRYLSPVVGVRQSDMRAVYLHSAALTNTPAIDGMVPIVNKHSKEDDDSMDELRKRLITLLGLKDDAGDDAIAQAVEALKGQVATEVVAHKDILGLLELGEDATVDQAKARILTLKNPSGYVPIQEFNALKQRLDERDADDLVEMALKKGKIAPASADWLKQYALKDPSGAKAFVDSAPQVVPVGTELAGGKEPAAPGEIDEIQALVNKQLGLSDETFKKWQRSGE